jgi:hypothetical protein
LLELMITSSHPSPSFRQERSSPPIWDPPRYPKSVRMVSAGGTSIHSSGQMEHFATSSTTLDDCWWTTTRRDHGDYIIPIDIVNGLPYTPMRPYTDEEWGSHITWTRTPTGIPLSSTARSVTRPTGTLATQLPDRPSFPFDRTGTTPTYRHGPTFASPSYCGAVTQQSCLRVNLNAQDARYGGSNGGDVFGGPAPEVEGLSEWEPT